MSNRSQVKYTDGQTYKLVDQLTHCHPRLTSRLFLTVQIIHFSSNIFVRQLLYHLHNVNRYISVFVRKQVGENGDDTGFHEFGVEERRVLSEGEEGFERGIEIGFRVDKSGL